MRKLRRKYAIGLSLIIFFLAAPVLQPASSADNEIIKKLLGRWEGETGMVPYPHLWLVIQSVKTSDEEWTGGGRFGGDKWSRNVHIKIQANGSEVSLAFDPFPSANVELKLTELGELAGIFHRPSGKSRLASRFTLRKVNVTSIGPARSATGLSSIAMRDSPVVHRSVDRETLFTR